MNARQMELPMRFNQTMTEEQRTLVVFQFEEIEDNMSANDFQRDFFESLQEQWHARNSLSEKQRDALTRIYERITR